MRNSRLKTMALVMLIGLLASGLIGLHHYLQPEPSDSISVPKRTLASP
jgi:hypothetical protein